MPISAYCLSFFLFLFFSFFLVGFTVKSETAGTGLNETRDSTCVVYNAGVVLDVNSKMGAMANICLSMALSDFYAEHPNYGTRLSLQRWDLLDGVAAASSEYLPQRSVDASFAIRLGESSSSSDSPYLIRTALADFSRLAKATVSILENFERNQVILIYEDMEYGNAIVPVLTDALEKMDIQLSHKRAIPSSADDFQTLEELEVLMTLKSKVFVVHMTTALASRLFVVANKVGMMRKGFAWLVADDLSNFVDTMDPVALDSMKGVIGVRPYVPKTKALMNFKTRYKSLSLMKQNNVASELNLFGLWVYDTIWALAMSVEKIGTVNSRFLKEMKGRTAADVQISEIGPRRILEEILRTSFRRISGDFDLVNGQLQPLAYEIFNLTGKGEKMIGYWTPDQGISRNLGSARTTYSTSRNKLKKIITSGDTRRTLKTIDMPTIGGKWRIGVPGRTGFKEFVNIDPRTMKVDDELPGFSIEVFKAVWPWPYIPLLITNLYPLMNLMMIFVAKLKIRLVLKIHAAVGDISIVASRINCVDFTLPYLESEVTMLIKVRHDGPKDMWIFLKPLSWDLWLTIIFICIFIGIVVRVLERRESTEFNGSLRKLLSTIFTLPCLSVAIPQRDMVVTNCSRLVLVLWIFLAFILMQSYTANLSSILTVNQLQPAIPSIKKLRTSYVGYQNQSFVRDFLINQLGFKESMLMPYGSVDDYQDALSKGSENGGVSAIFDEIPYIKLFLDEYTTGYMMAGPTYRTDGLGFAFPIGSPLVANFSRAILNFTQGKNMSPIEKKYFGKISIDQDETGPVSSSSPSLTSRSFAGLFIIIGIVVLLALVVSENHIFGRLVQNYIFCNSHDVSRSGSRIQPTAEMTVTNNPPEINIIQEYQDSNQSDRDESTEEAILEVHSS
ncbi:hypothetical protein CRYUN_Cryun02cG0105500 [Craigia yunnanensis]